MIRPYKPADKKQLITLQNELMDHFLTLDKTGIFRRQPEYGRAYTDYCLKMVRRYDGQVYVAEEDGKIIGFVIGAIHKKDRLELTFYHPIKTGFVYMLYVQRAHQKSGIGGKLMDKIESYFKAKGCHIARLDAVGGYEFPYSYYKKRKYQAWGVDMIKRLRKV